MGLGVGIWFASVWIGDIPLPIERGAYMLSFVLITITFAILGILIPDLFKRRL